MALSKDTFSKLLPQNTHFQNCSFKKYMFRIGPTKNTFSKLISQKIHYINCSLSLSLSLSLSQRIHF